MPDYCYSVSSPKQDLLLHIKEEGIRTKRLLYLPKVIQTSTVDLNEGQPSLSESSSHWCQCGDHTVMASLGFKQGWPDSPTRDV